MDADAEVVYAKARVLKGYADAFNITDCQTAVVRISSIAAAVMVLREGLEPVMQMTCRDRNRIAMQADLLGAAALGIKNCLCIAGDHQSFSGAGRFKGHPGAKNVYDVDSIQLCNILKTMRDEGRQQGGDPLKVRPRFFVGAAWTPLGDPIEFRPLRLGKKVAAGADFIQTQSIFDVERFAGQMAKIRQMGLHEKTAILGGIVVPRSVMMMKYMNSNVAGVSIPDQLIARMAKAKEAAGTDKEKAKQLQEEEGTKLAVELIEQVRAIPGVKGVHLMAIEWETQIPEIVKRAGLFPRPQVPAES
jgi:5,10-methylenetetrahydrofolate reductase